MERKRYNEDEAERPKKRSRTSRNREEDEDLEDSLEHLIVKLGEKSTSSLEKNLEDLVDILDHDMTKSARSGIIKIICECVAEIPEKTSIYATLIGLLNNRNYQLGEEIIEVLTKNFKDCLKACEWEKTRAYVRLFGDLVNCSTISAGSLMNLYETLVDVTMEDNIPQTRSDFFVYAILSSLPWVGLELYEKKEQDLEQLLNTIDNYITKRQKPHHTALRVWYSDSPHPQEEYLDCLWTQISKLRSDKWVERHIYRPYLSFKKVLCEALQHNLANINIPPHESSYKYPYPRVIFRLFDYTDCPEGPILPGAHSIERYLIEENVRWILDSYFFDRKECAQILLDLQNTHKMPMEYVLIESILAELFALPRSKHLEIFYGSLLLKMCKMQFSTLPQVLAQAVEMLFDRIDTMNVACVDRFASWFAYHLSNFHYAWGWNDWSNCLTLDPLHPKPKFVRECLLKCMRLSYYQRIADLVPDNFKILLPDIPEPINKFGTEDSKNLPGFDLANKLNELMKSKAKVEEITNLLESYGESNDSDITESIPHSLKVDVFVTVLLIRGSKSFSHLFSALLKYNKILTSFNTSEDAQLQMLATIYEVWRCHPQLLVVVVEKLLKAEIVGYTAVVKWLFSKQLADDFTRSYIWEILLSTLKRQKKSVVELQKKNEKLKDKLNKIEEPKVVKENEIEIKEEEKEEQEAEEAEEAEQGEEDEIEKNEEKIESALEEQRELYLLVFKLLTSKLTEHIQRCESKGKSFKNHWFRWSIGRLQQSFYEHHEEMFKFVPVLESLLFNNDIDPHISLIFKQFCSLQG